MAVSGTHDPVYQVSLVRHQKKALRLLVKPPNRIDPHRIPEIFRHCGIFALVFRTADDPLWFIKEKKDLFFFLYDRSAVCLYTVALLDLLPFLCRDAVHRDPARLQEPVRLSSGAEPCFA